MLSFHELTQAGQVQRLRALAIDVLREHFGFHHISVRLVADHSFNTVFRVDADGGRFAFRVGGAVRIHPSGIEDVEARWLDSLAEGQITAPRNIAPRDTAGAGSARWVRFRHVGVPEARVCTLFTWVDGVGLRTRLNRESSSASGTLLARLHEQALGEQALGEQALGEPGSSTPIEMSARDAIYFGDCNLIARHESARGAMFRDAEARVQAEIDHLWATTTRPHFLHGDFGPHNILAWRASLRPIDFQDMRLGHAVQDLGISLADMNRSRPEMVEPFLAGYAAVRELPDLSPQTLNLHAAARSLNIMNLGLLAPDSGIAQGFDKHAQRVTDWMSGTP